ncbi:MAG: glutamine synthetase III [Sphaerochaetaceae bacterium]|nr:glutamine synthetase III [Sphaerochaetaceae bacterium]
METITETYGSYVFDDKEMRRYLPKESYDALKATIKVGKELDINIANVVANAMKDWAVANGATHYTHWFQPLTGATAEKHDSFISPQKDGSVIMEFKGSELIKGEPDASSFPSGGLRATFEARGYTAWDPTSFAFIKEKTLCIPTAFCSYSGEVLDKKTPLLRSMEAINEQTIRILKLFGYKNVQRVNASVGLEQEYFLIDKNLFNKRRDLKFCGRTLLGSKPPKGQELEDHYFGAIKPRVARFMEELNSQLWKFGIPAKTEHNETAPAQHELASVHSNVNLAVDRNLLIMEEMKKTADKLGLSCLLHEKPFEGINGSGKHNNWSLVTDDGKNLLEPGDNYKENTRFLLFVVAVVCAMDRYNDLLCATTASASNDCRLGGDEAPPSVVSIFLGDELTQTLESIDVGMQTGRKGKQQMVLGVHVLPDFPKDSSDRNRTSPIAFTGNKFEFRMLGSQLNASEPNVVINTAVAETLCDFADILEKAENFDVEVVRLIKNTYEKHKRIVFNGNNYSEEWKEEAKKRGLFNFKSTAEAAQSLIERKNIALFEKFGIFTSAEVTSRYSIVMDHYSKTVRIEAVTMLEMLNSEVIPAAIEYSKVIAQSISAKKQVSLSMSCISETKLLERIEKYINRILQKIPELEGALEDADLMPDVTSRAITCSTSVISQMQALRTSCDSLEQLIGHKYWPYPTNEELIFSV